MGQYYMDRLSASLEDSYAKSPRWKSGKDFAVWRLDKNNYRIILPTFEARTGKRVEAVAEDK